MTENDRSEIAKRAYEIWEREGRPHGREEEHWLRAVEELAEEAVAASSGAAVAVSGAETMTEKPVSPPASVAAPESEPAPKAAAAAKEKPEAKPAPKATAAVPPRAGKIKEETEKAPAAKGKTAVEAKKPAAKKKG